LGVTLLVGLLLVAGLISSLFQLTFIEAFEFSSGFLCDLMSLLFMGAWLYGLKASGQVLLDCGPNPRRSSYLVLAAVPLVLVVSRALRGDLSWSLIAALVCSFQIGIMFLIWALGRLQFRQNGLWKYYGLLRWDKIESCQWSQDSRLRVKPEIYFSLLDRGDLPIPPEQKRLVDELLQKHCPIWNREEDPQF
jgi:hypothetical protein